MGKANEGIYAMRPTYSNRPERNPALRSQYEHNKKIILATQSVCAICGLPVDKSLKYPDPWSASIDHIIPVSKRGDPIAIENLQLAHRKCNRNKSDKLPGDIDTKRPEDVQKKFFQTCNWRTE